MPLTLPSVADVGRTLPDRVSDNATGENGDEGYARWWKYPTTSSGLAGFIETAFQARTSLGHLVDNSRSLRERNAPC